MILFRWSNLTLSCCCKMGIYSSFFRRKRTPLKWSINLGFRDEFYINTSWNQDKLLTLTPGVSWEKGDRPSNRLTWILTFILKTQIIKYLYQWVSLNFWQRGIKLIFIDGSLRPVSYSYYRRILLAKFKAILCVPCSIDFCYWDLILWKVGDFPMTLDDFWVTTTLQQLSHTKSSKRLWNS